MHAVAARANTSGSAAPIDMTAITMISLLAKVMCLLLSPPSPPSSPPPQPSPLPPANMADLW
eukprot:UC1_evm3s502